MFFEFGIPLGYLLEALYMYLYNPLRAFYIFFRLSNYFMLFLPQNYYSVANMSINNFQCEAWSIIYTRSAILGSPLGLDLVCSFGRAARQVGPRAPVKRDKLGIRRRGGADRAAM